MNTYYKEKQDGRLIHYESSFYNRAYEDTISDVESRMYAKPYEIEEYLDNDPKSLTSYVSSCMTWETPWVDLAPICT